MKELTVRYRMRRVAVTSVSVNRIVAPADAAAVLVPLLRHESVEVGGVLCLSSRLDVLGYHEVSRGTLDASLMHPRDILRIALLMNAGAVVVGHNHPSGDVAPSPEDDLLTTRLVAAGHVVGIDISDHLIVTPQGSYFSFKASGRL